MDNTCLGNSVEKDSESTSSHLGLKSKCCDQSTVSVIDVGKGSSPKRGRYLPAKVANEKRRLFIWKLGKQKCLNGHPCSCK